MESVGGQTTDEGGELVLPMCTHTLNYGPIDVAHRRHSVCHLDVQVEVPGWTWGDATPPGHYHCTCPSAGGQRTESEVASCEQALVEVCNVDLDAPMPCSKGDTVCWPVWNQPGAWTCKCSQDDALSQVEGNSCDEARLSHCGADPVYICEGWGGDAAAPMGGGCRLAPADAGTPGDAGAVRP